MRYPPQSRSACVKRWKSKPQATSRRTSGSAASQCPSCPRAQFERFIVGKSCERACRREREYRAPRARATPRSSPRSASLHVLGVQIRIPHVPRLSHHSSPIPRVDSSRSSRGVVGAGADAIKSRAHLAPGSRVPHARAAPSPNSDGDTTCGSKRARRRLQDESPGRG